MKKVYIFILILILVFGLIYSAQAYALSSNKVLGTNNQNLIIRRANFNDQKLVALTFDDGPSPTTKNILNVLEENNVKATFFVVGQNIDLHKDVLVETYQKGHEIGNHTNSHPITIWMNQQAIAKEILITEEKIHQAIGIKPKIIRAPYALYPKNLLSNVELFDMLLISWDVDPEDWRVINSEIIIDRVIEDTTPGSIILLHDGPPQLSRDHTVEALPKIIKKLKEDGYSFITVSQLLYYQKDFLTKSAAFLPL